MKGRTHLLVGTAAGLYYSYLTTLNQWNGQIELKATVIGMSAIAACILGSLFPDIDTPDSAIGIICKPVSFIIYKLLGHRTLLHSLLPYTILYLLASRSTLDWVHSLIIPFTLGIATHLLLDTLNGKGIPLFYPFKKYYRFLRSGKDSSIEKMLQCLLSGFCVGIGISYITKIIVKMIVG